MSFGADDVQTAGHVGVAILERQALRGRCIHWLVVVQVALLALHHAFAELDVGTASGQVGGDGHHTGLSRVSHDFRLVLVILGVEYTVLDPSAFQHPAESFGRLHRGGAD